MDVPVDSLHRKTGGDLSQSLLHREVLGPQGIGDIASVVFRDRFGCWGSSSRSSPRPARATAARCSPASLAADDRSREVTPKTSPDGRRSRRSGSISLVYWRIIVQ
jgi:hypothetical protein